MDVWNPASFDKELRSTLTEWSDLVAQYHIGDKALMDEHLNSDPYESRKPNPLYSDYSSFREDAITPLLTSRKIRVWHYSRLVDDEVAAMRNRLVVSTLAGLKKRLEALVGKSLLTDEEARSVLSQSPLYAQEANRAGLFWTVSVPVSPSDHGVSALLSSWGGESAYFGLKDSALANKLTRIGVPCIIEVETELRDRLNAFTVAGTVVQAWAKSLGAPATIEGSDLAITDCLSSARVLAVHTRGDETFGGVAVRYPPGCKNLRDG